MKTWIASFIANKRNDSLIATVIILLHLSFMISVFFPVSSGPDSAGYHVQARQIAERGQTWIDRDSPMQYIPPHWLPFGDDRFVSRYPAGLPLMLAPVYMIGGSYAVTIMNPLFTSLALFFLFLVAREWVGARWALIALLVMAVNQVANTWTLMGDAHPAVAFFLLFGIYLLIQWSKYQSIGLAFMAGLVLGTIPTIRYVEGVYAIGIALFLLLHWRKKPNLWPSIFTAILAAAIPMLLLLLYNKLALGVFWRSTYDLGYPIFGWEYFTQKFFPYLGLLIVRGLGFFFLMGLAGIIWMLARQEFRKEGALLAGIVFPVTWVYMAYFFFDMSLRFLLPTLYLYTIAAVWFLKQAYPSRPKIVSIATTIFVFISILIAIPQTYWYFQHNQSGNKQLYTLESVVRDQVEPGSILIAPSPVNNHLALVGQWRLADSQYFGDKQSQHPHPPRFDGNDKQPARMGMPMIPMGDQSEIHKRYLNNEDGVLSKILIQDLKEWTGSENNIYWLGSSKLLTRLKQLNPTIGFQTLEKFEATQPNNQFFPPPPRPDGPGREENDPIHAPGFGPPTGGPPGGHPGQFRMYEEYVLAKLLMNREYNMSQ